MLPRTARQTAGCPDSVTMQKTPYPRKHSQSKHIWGKLDFGWAAVGALASNDPKQDPNVWLSEYEWLQAWRQRPTSQSAVAGKAALMCCGLGERFAALPSIAKGMLKVLGSSNISIKEDAETKAHQVSRVRWKRGFSCDGRPFNLCIIPELRELPGIGKSVLLQSGDGSIKIEGWVETLQALHYGGRLSMCFQSSRFSAVHAVSFEHLKFSLSWIHKILVFFM